MFVVCKKLRNIASILDMVLVIIRLCRVCVVSLIAAGVGASFGQRIIVVKR